MADPLKEAVPRLGRRFLFVGDGYYGSQIFRGQTDETACDFLVRFAKNRLLYREPPPALEKPGPGHPTWHGAPLHLKDPATHGHTRSSVGRHRPEGQEGRGTLLAQSAFPEGSHPKGEPLPSGSPRRCGYQARPEGKLVPVLGARPSCTGGGVPPLRTPLQSGTCLPNGQAGSALGDARAFGHRSSLSAGRILFRCVRNTLFLARDLVEAQRQPWERECSCENSPTGASGDGGE